MNSHQEVYITENIIKNNVPLHNLEYKEIKNNGQPLYVEGQLNNKSFSYIHPILKKYKKRDSKNVSKKKKSVRFKKKLASTRKVGMPMLNSPINQISEKLTSKKKVKRRKPSKKNHTK